MCPSHWHRVVMSTGLNMKAKGQPTLRLVVNRGEDGQRSRCKESSLSAASPRGSFVRPCSISETDEAVSPTASPISESVMPIGLARRSEMRDAHVIMEPILREPVDSCQRLSVTELRDNDVMPRPPAMPKTFPNIGARVRWWRGYRKMSRARLAKDCGMSTTALSDLELNRTEQGNSLHLIAARLGLNPIWLQAEKGDPESGEPAKASEDELWPFPDIPPHQVGDLDRIELKYAQTALQEALEDIRQARRKPKKA